MASIPMTLTTAGLSALASALATSANVTVTHIELGTGHSATPASLTSLVTPLSPPVRLDVTFGGIITGTTTGQMSLQDPSETNNYEVREVGMFAGTVMVGYSSVAAADPPLAIKHVNVTLLYATNVTFVNGDVTNLVLPNNAMTFVLGSETMPGLMRKSTDAELTTAVEDGAVSTSPADVKSMIDQHVFTPLAPTKNVFTASGTWTKPTGAVRVKVELWGGGSAAVFRSPSTAGTGGSYAMYEFDADDLPATVAITVGNGGQTSNASGEDSTFGTFLRAYGGTTSRPGYTHALGNDTFRYYMWSGGRRFHDFLPYFGGGGGGYTGGADGQVSAIGGNGGDYNPSGDGKDGEVPGGGGGAGSVLSNPHGQPGRGARGEVRVTSYYA